MTSWAQRRRAVLALVGISLAIAMGVLIAIPFIYQTPSCSDGKQNQGELGIDCGGGCERICTAQAAEPSVRFARTLSQVGRTDVIAYIDNRNQNAAAVDVPYTIELYDETRTLVGKREGVLDLAPGMTTPLFVSGIPTGMRRAVQAFVVFDAEKVQWKTYEGRVATPVVRDAVLSEGALPRITAQLSNSSAKSFFNTAFVVTVFDATNNAIAASRTVVPTVPAGGEAQAIFTWPAAFDGAAVRIEVLPLPRP